MIRQYIELIYPALADAQKRAPADVADLVAALPNHTLAGPLSIVEREIDEGEPPVPVVRGVVGIEVDRPPTAPELATAPRLRVVCSSLLNPDPAEVRRAIDAAFERAVRPKSPPAPPAASTDTHSEET